MASTTFLRSFKLLICVLLLFTLASQAAFAADKEIRVYFNGTRMQFDAVKPIVKNNTTLVPFRKLFEAMGFDVKWNSSSKQAVGTKKGIEIKLTLNSTVANVNGKSVKLDVPAQTIAGNTMIPLRFVSESSGYRVTFSDSAKLLSIYIGSSISDDQAEPYIVKGRVIDSNGHPVKGAEIVADNQLLYNSNLITVTDANGFYRIELPSLATTWHMSGSYQLVKDGQSFKVDLTPEVDQPFAGNTGAIRNFTLQKESAVGELFLYMDLNDFMNGYSEDNVELTLTPIGGGKPITGKGYNFPGGFGMNDIPVGKYKATARYAASGEDSKSMQIRIRNTGQYANSVEFEFKQLVPGIYQAELEVKMP